MKYCAYCGTPNDDDAVFCGKCGKPWPDGVEKQAVVKPQKKVNALAIAVAVMAVFIVVAIVIIVMLLIPKNDNEAADNQTATTKTSENAENKSGDNAADTETNIEAEADDGTKYANNELKDFVFSDFTIQLPAYWEDLVTIKEKTGVITFMQTSSFEQNSDGELCYICAYADDTDLGDMEGTVLGRANGLKYVLTYPQDVTFVYEDQAISDEYHTLEADIELMKTHFKITVAQTDFIFPRSDTVLLTEADLEGLTPEELDIARNEIYARHGRIFEREDLAEYFTSKPWYQGTVAASDFTEALLNEIEIANGNLILEYEKKMGYK